MVVVLQNPKAFCSTTSVRGPADTRRLFNVIFHVLLQKLFVKMGIYYGIRNHKNTSICNFEAL